MAHMIERDDIGMVAGLVKSTDTEITPTWHGHPNYEVLNSYSVPSDMAAKAFSTKFTKVQSYTPDMQPIDGAFHIVNETGSLVAPMVGNQYVATDRPALWNYIEENFLASFPDLGIESAGTLMNTRIAFVNFKINEMNIKGDNSPTLNRLMLFDPIGCGALNVNQNCVRVVCHNTLTAAKNQAHYGESKFKISHTRSAASRVNEALDLIAETKMNLARLEENLNVLAGSEVTIDDVNGFLDHMFPIKNPNAEDGKKNRGDTMAIKKREAVLNIFENDQDMAPSIARSRYSLLNAFTNFTGIAKTGKRTDKMAIEWDNLTGNRAGQKQKALEYLLATV
jgi:hypothetical protein